MYQASNKFPIGISWHKYSSEGLVLMHIIIDLENGKVSSQIWLSKRSPLLKESPGEAHQNIYPPVINGSSDNLLTTKF